MLGARAPHGTCQIRFLRSRVDASGVVSINLPEGSEHDPEDANTVHALGERKTELFLKALQKGIDPAAGAEALLKKLREVGIRTAVGSSSKNTSAILHAAGLEHHFDVRVDGLDAEALRLRASRTRRCISKPPVASAFSRRAQCCSRMHWLG